MKQGTLTAGMEFTDEKKVWIWEGDIFGGNRKSRRKRRKTRGEQIKSFADVQAGDYVVHESHGIGKFVGIEQLTVQGVRKDYLKVKYAGEDSLYIPVDQLGMLQQYIEETVWRRDSTNFPVAIGKRPRREPVQQSMIWRRN